MANPINATNYMTTTSSPLLDEIAGIINISKGLTPGSQEPIPGSLFKLTPQMLALPQCHTEEVQFFCRIAERLALEKDTISKDDFRSILSLLPEIIPSLKLVQRVNADVKIPLT